MKIAKTCCCTLAVALCVAAVLPARADTYKDRFGLTWTYTVTSGTGVTLTAVDDKSAIFAASNFPWTFTNNDTDYTVTALGANLCNGWSSLTGKLTIPSAVKTVGSNVFDGCSGLTGLTIEEGLTTLPYTRTFYACGGLSGPLIIPHSVGYIGRQTFLWIGEKLTSVWFKGPEAVESGEQPYTTLDQYSGNMLYPHDKLGLKVALFGPYTKPDSGTTSNNILHALNGCVLYLPRNGYWLEENLDSYFHGTKTVLFYGPGEELDISIDETKNVLTATPTTVHALTNVMASAALFKSDLGLDTKISITNAFTYSASQFTGTTAQNVTFERLMFSVKTQAELTEILTTFPAPIKLAIDPSGLTETLSVPGSREIHVKIGDGYKIKKRTNGFEILIETLVR